ncbi:MAG: cyclic nucleotide-binding protein [Cellvibrionaceae bacterium]|nr:cyclic nucleotide-binding protein [Cellvibrionaceae bacterium]|tara:strand:+ start:3158 stop:4264 length:1107 start_codon:yes stop_codon:yes gene_type:complete
MESTLNAAEQLDFQQLETLVPLGALMESHLATLLEESELSYRFTDDVLFEVGQFDGNEYFLLAGEVELADANGNTLLLKGRSTLESIAQGQPRQYRAKVIADAKLLMVKRSRLEQLLDWSQSAEHLLVELAVNRAFDEDAAWLETVLKSNLFLKVPPTNVGAILKKLKVKTVSADEVIVRQGELGDRCYFIKEGSAEVTRNQLGGRELLATIEQGRCFGEDALITETVRNANVTMTSDGVLLELSKEDFLPLLKKPDIPVLQWTQKSENTVLLDVRTEEEYTGSHLSFAANLPLHLLHLKHRLLNPAQRYVTYCSSGARAASACYFLRELGYSVEAISEPLFARQDLSEGFTSTDYILSGGVAVESVS